MAPRHAEPTIYASDPCTTCGDQATGVITGRRVYDDEIGYQVVEHVRYDPPPASCDCECHAAWRFIHNVPAMPEAVAS